MLQVGHMYMQCSRGAYHSAPVLRGREQRGGAAGAAARARPAVCPRGLPSPAGPAAAWLDQHRLAADVAAVAAVGLRPRYEAAARDLRHRAAFDRVKRDLVVASRLRHHDQRV